MLLFSIYASSPVPLGHVAERGLRNIVSSAIRRRYAKRNIVLPEDFTNSFSPLSLIMVVLLLSSSRACLCMCVCVRLHVLECVLLTRILVVCFLCVYVSNHLFVSCR